MIMRGSFGSCNGVLRIRQAVAVCACSVCSAVRVRGNPDLTSRASMSGRPRNALLRLQLHPHGGHAHEIVGA